jgi:hypothetical protein
MIQAGIMFLTYVCLNYNMIPAIVEGRSKVLNTPSWFVEDDSIRFKSGCHAGKNDMLNVILSTGI